MNVEVINIIDQLSREKGIDRSVLIDALKLAMESAARKRFPDLRNVEWRMDQGTGEGSLFLEKEIVKKVADDSRDITLAKAKEYAPDAKTGEMVWVPHTLENYGRIAAQLAKQVILQKVREAEIENVFKEFEDKKGQLVNGVVQRIEHGDLFVDLGKAEGILPRREQVFREAFNRGERIRAYVLEVKKTGKSAMVILSRTHVGLIRRLFEMEVPEISEGLVEIMGIVREPNGRTKIAVKTNDRDIDAVGACVGMRGMRVQAIVQELRGEKIDIVEYSEDPEVFVRHALSPAQISRIVADHKEQHMTIIVADDQMSLAIGKKGQNVKLAAKLVKWKIDIKGESEARAFLTARSPLLLQLKPQRRNFFETLEKTVGLDDSTSSLLAAHGMATAADVIARGVEGLCAIPGLEREQASLIVSIAQAFESLLGKSLATEAAPAAAQDAAADGAEEPEYSVRELHDIDGRLVDLLEEKGFRTLAELSVTPVEDLLAIEGMDEATATAILQQAREKTGQVDEA